MTNILAGTADVVSGSPNIVWHGAPLYAAICPPDSAIAIAGAVYFVLSLTDTTHVVLTRNFVGSTASGLVAEIDPYTDAQVSTATLNASTAKAIRDISVVGTNAAGLFYNFSAATTGAPATSVVYLNNADVTLATFLEINNTDANNQAVNDRIDEWSVGDEITIRATDGSARITYTVSSAPVDETGYRQAGVTYVGKSGIVSDGATVVIERIAKGAGVPVGGATGQALKKVSATDYDVGWAPSREVLAAARTYYVDALGSDSNDGLSTGSSRAFLTIQKAIDTAAALDSSIYDVTVQLADGTYSTPTGNILKSMVGAGAVNIVGNLTTPGNVIVTTTGAMSQNNGNFYSSNCKTTYRLSGVKFTSTGTGSPDAINVAGGGYVEYSTVEFGSGFNRHVTATDFGYIQATGNYAISAGGAYHVRALSGEFRMTGKTVTITGTPAFSTAFAESLIGGEMIVNGNTFSGSATGVRYNAAANGVIYTAGAASTYLPGSTTGTTSTGGQYA